MASKILPKKGKGDSIHSGVKAALSLIPVVGGSIAEIFNSLIVPPIAKRKEEWMQHVASALEYLEAKNTGFIAELIKNDEFSSLLISTSIHAYKTHLKEKHNMLKNALINSTKNDVEFELKQVYVNFVDQLTLPHIEILKILDDFEDRIINENKIQRIYDILIEGNIDPIVPQMTKMEITTFRFLVKDLEAKGLLFISKDLRDLENQVYESTYIVSESTEKDKLPFIRLTNFGKSFLHFIKENF